MKRQEKKHNKRKEEAEDKRQIEVHEFVKFFFLLFLTLSPILSLEKGGGAKERKQIERKRETRHT